MNGQVLIQMYLAIAKKQKSAVNVLLLAPTFVRKFAPEFANRPAIGQCLFMEFISEQTVHLS